MSQVLAMLGFLVLVSGLRVRALTDEAADRRVVLLGIAAVAVTAAVLAQASRGLVDFLSVSPPTFWVAAGVVMAAAGLTGVVRGVGRPWPVDSGSRSAFVPIAFPILSTPALVMHSLASGLEYQLGSVIALLLAAGVAVLSSATSFPSRFLAPVIRMEGAFVGVLGIVWLVEGTRGLLL